MLAEMKWSCAGLESQWNVENVERDGKGVPFYQKGLEKLILFFREGQASPQGAIGDRRGLPFAEEIWTAIGADRVCRTNPIRSRQQTIREASATIAPHRICREVQLHRLAPQSNRRANV